MEFEFLIPRRPLSLQAKRQSLQAWKVFVRDQAKLLWSESIIHDGDLHLTLVYLSDEAPPDVDNIVKPIQDALVGLVFSDDALIADVESHRRPLVGTFDLTRMPDLLIKGLQSAKECVYVKLCSSLPLEGYL